MGLEDIQHCFLTIDIFSKEGSYYFYDSISDVPFKQFTCRVVASSWEKAIASFGH
jgi:hypothetical protein